MKKFDRDAVFAEVDASNKRFDTYTEAERQILRENANKLRELQESHARLAFTEIIAASCMM